VDSDEASNLNSRALALAVHTSVILPVHMCMY
jgi:hypothetical protein